MEVKRSKVTNVQSKKPWDSPFGIMYKFEISMENGDIGQYLSKNQDQDKFRVGEDTEYEYISGEFPKIKPHFNQSYGEKFRTKEYRASKEVQTSTPTKTDDIQLQIIRQSSVRTAVEISNGIEDLLDNANILTDWVLTGKTPNFNQEKPF